MSRVGERLFNRLEDRLARNAEEMAPRVQHLRLFGSRAKGRARRARLAVAQRLGVEIQDAIEGRGELPQRQQPAQCRVQLGQKAAGIVLGVVIGRQRHRMHAKGVHRCADAMPREVGGE